MIRGLLSLVISGALLLGSVGAALAQETVKQGADAGPIDNQGLMNNV